MCDFLMTHNQLTLFAKSPPNDRIYHTKCMIIFVYTIYDYILLKYPDL